MTALADFQERILQIVDQPSVLQRLPEPIKLASGYWSSEFIDGKHAVAEPDALDLVGAAMLVAARDAEVEFDAVGGLVLGAVPFTFAFAAAARCQWFLIRKEPKGRGTNLWVEGARIEPGMPVVVVDDVVTTGGSIRDAYDRVREQGGEVVFATTLVDRSDTATEFFADVGVPYTPMLTYRDLGIDPIGHEPTAAAAAR